MLMKSIPQKTAVISCAMLLGIGLATATRADYMSSTTAAQSDRRQGNPETTEQQSPGNIQNDQSSRGKTMKGEVVRVEGDTWFIKDERGKEVQLHVDQTTRRSPQRVDDKNMKGVVIEAMVNDQHHALSISSPDRRDDRHDHSTADTEQRR
jgi:uncharacterized protein YdeI (BOF family)